MADALIALTLTVSAYSCWVRRDTWWTRWEIGASLAIVLEAVALVLMSPAASTRLSPVLYHITTRWNVQQVLGHLCFIAAIAAVGYHALLRVVDGGRAAFLLRLRIVRPALAGAAAMLAAFVAADEGYHADLFTGVAGNAWMRLYWACAVATLVYLCVYTGRIVLAAGADPRAKETVTIYLVSATFAVVACLIQGAAIWLQYDVSSGVWVCACLAVASFAFGSARSWRAKEAWFTSQRL